VAAKLDVGQISDITAVIAADTFERPIYAGNAIATVQSADATKVITVRSTGFDAAQPPVVLRRWKPQPLWPTLARAPSWAVKSPRATAPS
jgi:Electron transfer flavoprotein, alpha subunit